MRVCLSETRLDNGFQRLQKQPNFAERDGKGRVLTSLEQQKKTSPSPVLGHEGAHLQQRRRGDFFHARIIALPGWLFRSRGDWANGRRAGRLLPADGPSKENPATAWQLVAGLPALFGCRWGATSRVPVMAAKKTPPLCSAAGFPSAPSSGVEFNNRGGATKATLVCDAVFWQRAKENPTTD
jgi:hypothetical protein